MDATQNFQPGDEVVASKHFTDPIGERHIAGQPVGTVTSVDQRGAEDVVEIDGVYNVRPASEFLTGV